jgi:hypothetical protein
VSKNDHSTGEGASKKPQIPKKVKPEAPIQRGAEGKKAVLPVPTSDSKAPGWYMGMRTALRYFSFIAAIVVGWCLVSYFALLDKYVVDNGTLILSVVLFFLGFPVSIFFRLDNIMEGWSGSDRKEIPLLFALAFILINFLLIGACRGWRKELEDNTVPGKRPESKRTMSGRGPK